MSRRKNEPTPVEMLFEIFQMAPWFVGPVVATFAYVLLAWGVPWWLPPLQEGDTLQNKTPAHFIGAPLGMMLSAMAPFAAGLVLIIWGAAEASKFFSGRRLNRVQDTADLSHLDWREFEKLLCEVFRRQGYAVEHSGRAAADGGIDIRLMRSQQLSLVQCKHWKAWQVGVKVVRELRGVVASERAQWGIVVTSGTFTNDAIEFAQKNNIQLIDGAKLGQLIGSVQADREDAVFEPAEIVTQHRCYLCGGSMVRRTAKKGPNAGSQFLGCERFPKCRATRELKAVQ